MSGRLLRRIRLRSLNLLLILGLLLPALPARAQETPPATPAASGEPQAEPIESGYTLGQCRSIDSSALRAEIENAALAVIGSGSSSLDIEAIVDRKWAELNVDAVVDAEVAAAVASLAGETDYWQRLLSGWSAQRAEEFASEIASRAFGSEAFGARLDDLSFAIGEEIARSVNAELARAASAAFLCLRDYVGASYSATLFDAFEQSVSRRVGEAPLDVDASALGVGALDVHMLGIAGASVIVITEVGRRVATKISEKLAQRVAGKVVGRVVGRAGSSLLPVIGWVVGIGMIVWDLYEGGKGALPQIEEALTSEEVKQRIRAEVTDAVRASLPEEAAIAALETAVSMLDEWDTFCADHRVACSLAGENASFRNVLSTLPLSGLTRLDALLAVFDRELGRSALDRALETGQFDQLLALPDSAMTILAETRSVETTLLWAAMAGQNLDQVMANGIHRRILPQEIDPARLEKLLSLNDGVLVQKFLALDAATRDVLWSLSSATLADLLTRLNEFELADFAAALARRPAASQPALASDFLAGALTWDDLRATPVPTAAPPTATMPAAVAAASTSTPVPPALPTATAASGAANPPASPWLTAGLGALVVVLALVAAALWLRGLRRQPKDPSGPGQ